jgi:hypothetical protein
MQPKAAIAFHVTYDFWVVILIDRVSPNKRAQVRRLFSDDKEKQLIIGSSGCMNGILAE